jgi:hypothetical protein
MKTTTPGLILLSICLGASAANAASTQIDYDMSGGALFITASGTVAARVNYYVGSFAGSTTAFGTASGATSWNISGNIGVSVDPSSGVSTAPVMLATRRAGTINVNFPLFDLGGLISLDIDASVLSNDSIMFLDLENATAVNSTDWSIDQDYRFTTGQKIVALGTSSVSSVSLVPMVLELFNTADQSLAELVIRPGDVPSSFFNGTLSPGCQLTGVLGNCLAGITSIEYDLSSVTLTPTAATATGASATLLPVPVPAAIWLLTGGLGSLVGFARRRQR